MAKPGEEAEDGTETDRRESILEAARDVFQRYGYRKATMEDIAVAAGITRQTLYRYFRGKKVLLTSLLEWEATRALMSNLPSDFVSTDSRDKLRLIFLSINSYLDRDPFLKGIARRDPDVVTPDVIRIAQRFERRMTELVAQLLKEGMSEGVVYETEPELLAYALVRLHEAFFLSGYIDGSRFEPEEIVRFFDGFMENALPPRCEGPGPAAD
ncbi:MAG: TetR/AcrR family transcriptional regulator [Actinobacteria bacterium]|nr:TetR/AcrR family transcriptional regulator [Actinomycetota bacterium]MBU1944356.1 TetR/AcrR family transcriptional regulator [Actinomycetota bacterium]MBU2688155.1 TetR/AcrR family transcriptional regulator [Actinomycetota bacterium]